MSVRIEVNAEPIPGYRLIERLGSGGFGEVWKAEAPGGLLKAIKFVHGDLEAVDDAEGARAGQELKAMDRVRKVRHAYILSIERFEIIEGQLIIVTELADRTLWDRFRECNRDGLRGIPRNELIAYLGEAAEALDYMIEEYDLQHLDIKPQNLFLVHKHVKVADFGLAKDLGGKQAATVTGGVTPVYAAPETFDGWLSRFSDQYSLAIVYQELLTGKRPFNGTTMRQLVMQHLQGTPDLSDLPVIDQPVVAKALAKAPESRFATCFDFVKALREVSSGAAVGGVSMPPPPKRESVQVPDAGPKTMRAGNAELDEGDLTQGPRGKKATPPVKSDSGSDKSAVEYKPQVLPPRPDKRADAQFFLESTSETPVGESARTAPAGRARPSEHGQPRPVAIGQPALVVGLGRLGLETLQQLRHWLDKEIGPAELLPRVRLLGIDTDPIAMSSASHGPQGTALQKHELVLARLQRPGHYLKNRDGLLPLDSWLNSKLLYRIPRQQDGAGLRALGRLALVDHHRAIMTSLERELAASVMGVKSGGKTASEEIALRNLVPRVYVVASLGGNTGSGMFLDTAYLLRHTLRKLGYSHAHVIGMVFLPADTDGRSAALANAHAALKELAHYSSGQVFSALFEGRVGAKPFIEAGPPFQRVVAIPLPEQQPGKSESQQTIASALSLAGQFLYRDLATPLGSNADDARRDAASFDLIGKTLFQSIGLHRIYWPRRRLLNCAARKVCHRLVTNWMKKDARSISAEVRQWSLEQWDALGLRAENLIARHQEQCERRLKQGPESLFQEIIQEVTEQMAAERAIKFAPIVQAMEQIDQLLGVPEECRLAGAPPTEPGSLETKLAEGAEQVAAECEQNLAEVIVRLIEEPAYRLAGAEEALRQFSATVEQALQAQEHLAKEIHERSILLHQRIATLVETPIPAEQKQNSFWAFGRKTPNLGVAKVWAEILDLLKAYPKCRYQSLILAHINRLYVALRGLLSDQIREVGFCRQRLGELAGIIQDKPETRTPADPTSKNERDHVILPTGSGTLADAADRLDQAVGPEELHTFDQQVQALVRKEYRALVQICLGPSHVVKALAPLMLREGEAFLEPRLQQTSVADMFLHQTGTEIDKDSLVDALERAFDKAEPGLGAAEDVQENALVVVPADAQGSTLASFVKEIVPTARVIQDPSGSEIVFFRERPYLTSSHLAPSGPAGQKAYDHRLANDPGSLHTRMDIAEWQSSLPEQVASC